MGGKSAARGFYYQAFAAVLEALCQNNWDKIYVEPDTNNDKVDIALEKNNQIFKSIQVKSTINTFDKKSIKKWLSDLIADDVGATEFELYLIGQCENNAITFINAIEKCQENRKLDNTARDSLEGFDTSILQGKRVAVTRIDCNLDTLEARVHRFLHRYLSDRNIFLPFDQIDFVAKATVNEQMVSSTHGKGIERILFDDELTKHVLQVADKFSPERKSIRINSFIHGEVYLEDQTNCLSLTDKFEGRYLKEGLDWNKDIFENTKKFLLANTNHSEAYQIVLDTHLSIAFAAGRILNSKETGINIIPIQNSEKDGMVPWEVKVPLKKNFSDWEYTVEPFNESQCDSALILNIRHNIYDHVVQYIKENRIPIGKIINCKIKGVEPSGYAIVDGSHAAALAEDIYKIVKTGTIEERQAVLHIFAAVPNAFMFFLGRSSLGFGQCVLYEHDYELGGSSYSPSIKF